MPSTPDDPEEPPRDAPGTPEEPESADPSDADAVAGPPAPAVPPAPAPYGTPPPPQFAPPPGGPQPAPAPQQPPGDRRRFGRGIAAGLGIGCGAYVLGIVLALGTLGVASTIFGFLWPFIAIAVVSIALMFSPRTRPYGTGMLIMTGAAWLIVIGPCIALLGGYG
ncbi:hypothetical protein [Microbacterium lushaniae]|uniref:Uncharacterized protein n=1 Tax=Microbacterium lushaniae TaxID=2614639 RepID=A0A5J6L264_9MICO|nr:hypothetical protein [Microbacterium lushaniae]QEW02560.1 hypothetical protein F6J85_05215 [Microbacterium lushaniae]